MRTMYVILSTTGWVWLAVVGGYFGLRWRRGTLPPLPPTPPEQASSPESESTGT